MFSFVAVGNLTDDARIFQHGERFAISFTVAVNSYGKDKQATFLNVTYWTSSDAVHDYLKKGKKVAVSGNWYENKKGTSGDRWFQTFVAQNLELLGGSAEGERGSQPQRAQPQRSEHTSPPFEYKHQPIEDEEDGLPF